FDRNVTEIFYSLTHTKWHRGYATETAKAMLDFGFNVIKLDRIIGFIEPGNNGSRRVLEKSGLREIGSLDYIPKENDFFGNTLFEITYNDYLNLK
ncbi:MAG: acetyltransferase, partial [Clostridiales bacterium]|nr:acetyltransferase [Clostridiales bacterium]